mmetsp:Transcript_5542/g.9185  ORF Transcript_5542/g.9185 Transcript_5542/m.9185 type:complete len:205 (-) Transcript_5542:58-672(-)
MSHLQCSQKVHAPWQHDAGHRCAGAPRVGTNLLASVTVHVSNRYSANSDEPWCKSILGDRRSGYWAKAWLSISCANHHGYSSCVSRRSNIGGCSSCGLRPCPGCSWNRLRRNQTWLCKGRLQRMVLHKPSCSKHCPKCRCCRSSRWRRPKAEGCSSIGDAERSQSHVTAKLTLHLCATLNILPDDGLHALRQFLSAEPFSSFYG